MPVRRHVWIDRRFTPPQLLVDDGDMMTEQEGSVECTICGIDFYTITAPFPGTEAPDETDDEPSSADEPVEGAEDSTDWIDCDAQPTANEWRLFVHDVAQHHNVPPPRNLASTYAELRREEREQVLADQDEAREVERRGIVTQLVCAGHSVEKAVELARQIMGDLTPLPDLPEAVLSRGPPQHGNEDLSEQ